MTITSDDTKMTNNVIFSTFPNTARKGENQPGRPATVVSFEKPRETMEPKSTEFPIESYLDWLAEQKYLNPFEEKKLRAATVPLFQRYPKVDRSTKEQIEAEFAGEKTPSFTIADKEETHWRESLKNGHAPLPGFDYRQARAIFIAPPEEQSTRVRFLKPEFACAVPMVDVKRELVRACAFFHIILRMIRLQHEKDHPLAQALSNCFADDLPTENDFARVELKLDDVLREPSPPEPLADDLTEERAMLANIKAMAEQTRVETHGQSANKWQLRFKKRKGKLLPRIFMSLIKRFIINDDEPQ